MHEILKSPAFLCCFQTVFNTKPISVMAAVFLRLWKLLPTCRFYSLSLYSCSSPHSHPKIICFQTRSWLYQYLGKKSLIVSTSIFLVGKHENNYLPQLLYSYYIYIYSYYSNMWEFWGFFALKHWFVAFIFSCLIVIRNGCWHWKGPSVFVPGLV